jgi:hypothetical protein
MKLKILTELQTPSNITKLSLVTSKYLLRNRIPFQCTIIQTHNNNKHFEKTKTNKSSRTAGVYQAVGGNDNKVTTR